MKNNKSCSRVRLVTLAIVGLLLSLRAAAAEYTIADLGTLGGTASQAFGVNNKGQVVGEYLSGSSTRAFLWSNGTMVDLGGAGGDSRALGINNNGQVVGYYFTSAGIHASLWSGGTMTDLGTFGGASSAAFGINDNGQVTGWAGTVAGTNHTFLWSNGTMTDLGISYDSNGYGINSNGQVVGTAGPGPYHAFAWGNGVTTDLGTLGGTNSYASGINDNGQVVGTSDTDGSGQRAFLWRGGVMTDLGVLPGGTGSSAYSINKYGQIVGRNTVGAEGAFLYDDSLHDLNSLLPNGSGWFLTDARGINDAGQIVGAGIINGQTHAFLMTPVAIPGAFWLFGSGLVGLLGFRHRLFTWMARNRTIYQ